MIRKPAGTLTALVLALGAGGLSVPLTAAPAMAAVAIPHQFSSVASKPGPQPGEITFSWVHDGASTTGYVIETGLTTFSPVVGSGMALHGRGFKEFSFPAGTRSVTLTAAQVASAGAPTASANHLKWRIRAVNRTTAGETVKWYPYLQVTGVAPAVPAAAGTPLRVANFNIRTARATTDKQTWLQRVPAVTAQILAYHPGLVALQELGPGRADGVSGSTLGLPRQTDSLLTELGKQGGSRYKLIQTTPYVPAGTPGSTQGMRILYDSSKYAMLSGCADKTGTSSWNDVCTIKMPIRSNDTEDQRRKSVYSLFADRATGEKFYFVSVHLDARSDSNLTIDRTYDALRGEQAKATIAGVAKVNTTNLPVIFGGDLNTWQNDAAGNTAHEALVAAGYYDTAAATTQVKARWTTMNAFKTTLADPGTGFQARLDAVLTQGITGAAYFENVFKNPDDLRPSDHNMVVADVRLPAGTTTDPGTGTTDATAYVPVTPSRVLDTRNGTGGTSVPLAAGATLQLQLTGRAGLPTTGVKAVAVNITAVSPTAAGALTAYPTGLARPASNMSFPAGRNIANNTLLKVGEGGLVTLHSTAATDVVVDLLGWYPTDAKYVSVAPSRVLDTRNGTGAPAGPVAAAGTVAVQVTGRAGIPATGVASVVLNVTATGETANGYVTVHPTGVTRTNATTMDYKVGQTQANTTVIKLGTTGEVSLYSSQGTHLIADVVGWYPTVSDLTAVNPTRILDTRVGLGAPAAKLAAGGRVDLQVTGRGGVPASNVKAVVLNVTVISPTSGGNATAYTSGTTRTGTSTLNYVTGETIANGAIVKLSADGKVSLHSSDPTHLLASVVAYLPAG